MGLSSSTPPAESFVPARPVFLHASFVLTGMVTTLLGPILPALSALWRLDDVQTGYFFTAQFAGSTVGVLLSSVLLPRLGLALSLPVGYGLMALGVGSLGVGSWAAGLASIFVYGLGLGIVIPASNLLIAETNPSRRAAELNILNLAWGLGAVSCPPVVAALLLRDGGIAGLLLGLSLALGMVAITLLVRRPSAPQSAATESPRPSSLLRDRFLAVIGAVFFLYVGAENSLAGWVASYARRLSVPSGALWVLTPSFFWAALLLGRAVAPSILRRVREGDLSLAGLVAAGVGVALLLAAKSVAGVGVGVSLAGFGLASVFPIAIAMLSEHFGPFASRITGVAFALAGLGGATLPWLVGALSTRFGGLKAGLAIPLTAIMALIVLQPCASSSVTGVRSEISGSRPAS